MFETQTLRRACSRARAKTGNRMAARMAMMAITTSNSIRVKPVRRLDAVSMACLLSPYVRRERACHLPVGGGLLSCVECSLDGGREARRPSVRPKCGCGRRRPATFAAEGGSMESARVAHGCAHLSAAQRWGTALWLALAALSLFARSVSGQGVAKVAIS